jgi:hypothetical protein
MTTVELLLHAVVAALLVEILLILLRWRDKRGGHDPKGRGS